MELITDFGHIQYPMTGAEIDKRECNKTCDCDCGILCKIDFIKQGNVDPFSIKCRGIMNIVAVMVILSQHTNLDGEHYDRNAKHLV